MKIKNTLLSFILVLLTTPLLFSKPNKEDEIINALCNNLKEFIQATTPSEWQKHGTQITQIIKKEIKPIINQIPYDKQTRSCENSLLNKLRKTKLIINKEEKPLYLWLTTYNFIPSHKRLYKLLSNK